MPSIKRLLTALLCTCLGAWASDIRSDEVRGAHFLTTVGAVPKVNALGIIDETKITCSNSPVTCTLYDNTGGTGSSTWAVRSGPVQGAANLQEWKDAGGATQAFLSSAFGFSAVSYAIPGVGSISNSYSRMYTAAGYDSERYYFAGGPGAPDAAFYRSAVGVVELNSGLFNDGKLAGLNVGTLTLQSLATPAAPGVAPTCVPGVCNLTWSYNVAVVLGDGTSTEVGAVGSTALQNGTINAASYNTLTVAPVAGATSYRWYRTVSAGIPATLGLIGTTAAPTLVDNGLAGDTVLGPVVNATGRATARELQWVTGAESTCDVTNRFRVVAVAGGGGVADTFRICTKDGADAYGWRALY